MDRWEDVVTTAIATFGIYIYIYIYATRPVGFKKSSTSFNAQVHWMLSPCSPVGFEAFFHRSEHNGVKWVWSILAASLWPICSMFTTDVTIFCFGAFPSLTRLGRLKVLSEARRFMPKSYRSLNSPSSNEFKNQFYRKRVKLDSSWMCCSMCFVGTYFFVGLLPMLAGPYRTLWPSWWHLSVQNGGAMGRGTEVSCSTAPLDEQQWNKVLHLWVPLKTGMQA